MGVHAENAEEGTAAAVRLARGAPLRSTVDATDPAAWLTLDAGVREVFGYRSPVAHTGPPPVNPAQDEESRLALALCHGDGRVREKAVRRSAGRPGLLPLIVIRCADWADPVRGSARHLLREALDADAAVGLAPLILRVGRRDRGAFGVELLGEVMRRASPDRLAPLLTSPDRSARRFAHRLAIDEGLLGPVELARTAARDEDTVVQDLCATAALAALTDLPSGQAQEADETDGAGRADAAARAYEAVLAPLLSARHPRTRSAGVTALRRAGLSERAEAFLGDRSSLVRACARYVVRQHGGDPTAWYREWCTAAADPGLPPGAVVGLAESGNRPDAVLLWPLLDHPAGGVREGAVIGLRLLDSVVTDRLRPLLDDPAARVVRETAVALLPSAGQLPADWLLERLTGPQQHVRHAAFRLLDARGGIEALRAAVGLLADPDTRLRIRAGQSVLRWRPPADVRRHDPEVAELLDRSRHLFSPYGLLRLKWEAGLTG
ncbi:hypothetical protein [Streptomyces sp. NBC_00102]|uniref:hypothetical protein n=1 Tax=Streptomyces sp. NBC_00102 TaxID=2975652 RepID=UPI00225C2381|nr:hypothetical protein [Streptomyces sp. NBC_00102]MCX5395953.1 hypothetical protein [Streptomyces sp. NBC_00102]